MGGKTHTLGRLIWVLRNDGQGGDTDMDGIHLTPQGLPRSWLPMEVEPGQRAKATGLTQPGGEGYSLEIISSRFQSRSRLIGHRPHHNCRVIFVPAN